MSAAPFFYLSLRARNNLNWYCSQKMRDLARLHSPEIRQIDLDVNRTYRNHEMFRLRYGVKQVALFHVLAAYSMYNTVNIATYNGMTRVESAPSID